MSDERDPRLAAVLDHLLPVQLTALAENIDSADRDEARQAAGMILGALFTVADQMLKAIQSAAESEERQQYLHHIDQACKASNFLADVGADLIRRREDNEQAAGGPVH